jgi:branched-chain amino acid aminotransferase
MTVYLNGEFVSADEAHIRADDRGFLYSDALYESIRLYCGGFFRFRAHWQRLAQGAAALKIEAPTLEDLRGIVGRVAEMSSVSDGIVRVTLTRGPGGEGLRTLGSGPPTLLVTVRPLATQRIERAAAGFTAIVADARRSPVGLPSSIKSANRLDAILARLEADEAGVDEAVLLSAEGYVAEGTVSNIFWRRGEQLHTPELGIGILPGVTRMAILEVCRDLGIDVREGRWHLGELVRAREVFFTMSSLGPVRVVELDSSPLQPPEEALYPRVRDAYWSLVEREAAADPVIAP